MPASPIDSLRALLQPGLKPKAWFKLARLLDRIPADAREQAIGEAEAFFAHTPSPIERDMPLEWIRKLANGKSLPQARLANRLDLGNGLSLREPNGFDDFFTLTEEEALRLVAQTQHEIEILSYSDDVGDNPLHPGFVLDVEDAPHALHNGRWERVHTLRLNGWGLSTFAQTILDALPSFPALRALELDGGELDSSLDASKLRTLLASPSLQQLQHLSLQQYWDLDVEAAKALVDSPTVQRLQTLRMGEVSAEVFAVLDPIKRVKVEMTPRDED